MFFAFCSVFELPFFVGMHCFGRRWSLPLYILPLIYLIICTLLHSLTHSLCHDILWWKGMHAIQRDINEDESIFLIPFECFFLDSWYRVRFFFFVALSTNNKSHFTLGIWKTCIIEHD